MVKQCAERFTVIEEDRNTFWNYEIFNFQFCVINSGRMHTIINRMEERSMKKSICIDAYFFYSFLYRMQSSSAYITVAFNANVITLEAGKKLKEISLLQK